MRSEDYARNYKNARVKLTDGSVIQGQVNILNFTRVSDLLKHSTDKFLTILAEDGDQKRAVIVNREHIVWAETWD